MAQSGIAKLKQNCDRVYSDREKRKKTGKCDSIRSRKMCRMCEKSKHSAAHVLLTWYMHPMIGGINKHSMQHHPPTRDRVTIDGQVASPAVGPSWMFSSGRCAGLHSGWHLLQMHNQRREHYHRHSAHRPDLPVSLAAHRWKLVSSVQEVL